MQPPTSPAADDLAARARAWRRGAVESVCDVAESWAHGTVLRATQHPTYYDLNAVRVERDPGMNLAELVAFADEALAGLSHRQLDIEQIAVAEPLRAGFEALGWRTSRLLWMHHETPPPAAAREIAVETVAYDDVQELRVAWLREEGFPYDEPDDFHAHAREVALARGAQVLAVRDAGVPIAFAQIERRGSGAEIAQVYVAPEHRGGGRGTALTRAAIGAASDAHDLWICADDDGRPKELYARLGFRPAWTTMDLLRLPQP